VRPYLGPVAPLRVTLNLVDTIETIRLNLLSPMILAFALGIVATLITFPFNLTIGLPLYYSLAQRVIGG
jgi:hypothetical protein